MPRQPRQIYMDHHSTTPLDPRVFEEMLPYLREHFGNPSSIGHSFGRLAARAVEKARERVAALINASPSELIFTSGATESNNLAIMGVTAANSGRSNRILISAIEHSSVLEPCRSMRSRGVECVEMPVDSSGMLSDAVLSAELNAAVTLVSVIHANNEIGVVQDIAAIGAMCREKGALFHSDAAQSGAYVEINVRRMNADILTLSSHKMYGPKGIGALWIRDGRPAIPLEAILKGGGQERGLRPGTLNAAAIAGFGKAAEIALQERESDAARIAGLRDLLQSLLSQTPDVVFPISGANRLPGSLVVSFPDLQAEAVMREMPEIAVSSGAACSSGNAGPSHVLSGLGLEKHIAAGTLRFGLGRTTSEDDVRTAAAACARAATILRQRMGL